jgi:hypothetical protein
VMTLPILWLGVCNFCQFCIYNELEGVFCLQKVTVENVKNTNRYVDGPKRMLPPTSWQIITNMHISFLRCFSPSVKSAIDV